MKMIKKTNRRRRWRRAKTLYEDLIVG